MPKTEVIIYQEKEGDVPLIKWLDNLSTKAQDKCIERIERLAEKGYDLRRPLCDILEKGIYELRVREDKVHHRILYAFVGQNVALLSHGCFKTDKVPKREIKKAVENRNKYIKDPETHTYHGEL